MSAMEKNTARPSACQTCGRDVSLTFHHLIPRKVHRRPYFRKHKERLALQSGIFVCRLCHNGIHAAYDEMYLAKHLNTLKALINDEALRRHFDWVARQKSAGAKHKKTATL